MRELVERAIGVEGERRELPPPGGSTARKTASRGRSVTVNLRESPLGWLAARGLLTDRQVEAGEQLRADHEAAQMLPGTTMRWTPRVDGGRGGADAPDPGLRALAARRRFEAAIAAAGPGLADIAWRVVCALEPLPRAERTLGWPARAGRLVLGLALDRLADHYRLPGACPPARTGR